MNSIALNLNGDGSWPDLKDKTIHHIKNSQIGVSMLAGGMKSGLPSVSIRIDLPDGTVVVAETSARLLINASDLIKSKFPELTNLATPIHAVPNTTGTTQ